MFTRSLHRTPDMDQQGRLLTDVGRMVDDGAIRTTLTERISGFDAEGLQRAHGLVEQGRVIGKVAIDR